MSSTQGVFSLRSRILKILLLSRPTLIPRNKDFWLIFLPKFRYDKMNVLPCEQLAFASRSKSIFFSRFMFCCEILSCLLISVLRSLQMGQLGVVGKAPQKKNTSKKEGRNRRHRSPLKIRPAILNSFDFS